MQAVGTAYLLPLLAAVAVIAGTFGFVSGTVIRRHRRRTRTIFALGFLCGAAAAAIFDVRRRGTLALATKLRRIGRPLPGRVNLKVVDTVSPLRRAHLLLKDAVLMSSATK